MAIFTVINQKENSFPDKETGKSVTMYKVHVADSEGNVAQVYSRSAVKVGDSIEYDAAISFKGELVARRVEKDGFAK